jgi:hypothetical protein
LILQIKLIRKLYKAEGIVKKYLIITLLCFAIFSLFREDFGDTSNSVISPLSAISKYLGFRESARYKGMTSIGSILNFLWYGLLITQIVGLIKFKKKRKHNNG